MKHLENMNFDEERALYNSNMLVLTNCNFQGKADGESALKECINIFVDNCNFLLRYPFWHNKHVKIDMSYFSNKILFTVTSGAVLTPRLIFNDSSASS